MLPATASTASGIPTLTPTRVALGPLLRARVFIASEVVVVVEEEEEGEEEVHS